MRLSEVFSSFLGSLNSIAASLAHHHL
jgi:hypothetical protein